LTARATAGPTFRVGLPRKSLRVQDVRGLKSAMPEDQFESPRRENRHVPGVTRRRGPSASCLSTLEEDKVAVVFGLLREMER
jgi:hypothetical protein